MNDHDSPALVPALEHATHAIALWIEHSLRDLRITQAEAHVLAYLARHAPCAINDLHHSFGHKRSTLTSLLDRLEARGWILRGTDPRSRRQVLVMLTAEGRSVAERVHAAVRGVEERVRARAGDADATSFLRVLSMLEEELSYDG